MVLNQIIAIRSTKCDLILIITDRLIKYYYFIDYKKVFNVKKLIYTFKNK